MKKTIGGVVDFMYCGDCGNSVLEAASISIGDNSYIHEEFLSKVCYIFESNLDNEEFSIEVLAIELNMSRSKTFRVFGQVTGTSPNELLRVYRVHSAAKLLRSLELNVTQVMYQVGMNNPSYFATTFKKYYGMNPSEYRNLS